MSNVKAESEMLKRHRAILGGDQTGVEAELKIKKMYERYKRVVNLKLR